jgi:hypothetical protein
MVANAARDLGRGLVGDSGNTLKFNIFRAAPAKCRKLSGIDVSASSNAWRSIG